MTIVEMGWTVPERLVESWRAYLCSGQQYGWCKRTGRCRDRIRAYLGEDHVAKLAQCRHYQREIRIEETKVN